MSTSTVWLAVHVSCGEDDPVLTIHRSLTQKKLLEYKVQFEGIRRQNDASLHVKSPIYLLYCKDPVLPHLIFSSLFPLCFWDLHQFSLVQTACMQQAAKGQVLSRHPFIHIKRELWGHHPARDESLMALSQISLQCVLLHSI